MIACSRIVLLGAAMIGGSIGFVACAFLIAAREVRRERDRRDAWYNDDRWRQG